MSVIYMDESGNTGSNYLDKAQPVFTLSSVVVDPLYGDQILRECFPSQRGNDLKFKNVANSRAGRELITNFLKKVDDDEEFQFRCYLVYKPFALIAKYVDWLLEPIMLADGIDIYENGMARAIAQMLWFTLPHTYDEVQLGDFLTSFQSWATGRGTSSRELTVEALALVPDPAFERTDIMLKAPFFHAKKPVTPAGSDFKMDFALAAAYASILGWMDAGLKDIEIIHDQSNIMEAQAPMWEELADPVQNKELFKNMPGDWVPLSVSSLRFGDHISDPVLQLADIIAGANRLSAENLIGAKPDPFGQRLHDELDYPRPSAGSLWPENALFDAAE